MSSQASSSKSSKSQFTMFSSFESQVQKLISSGALRDFYLSLDKLRKETRNCITWWKESKEGATFTRSLITYNELKEDQKSDKRQVLETAQSEDVSTFFFINSTEKHHAIVDRHTNILGYRYRIPEKFLTILSKSTSTLPHTTANAKTHSSYPTHHYTVWREYKPEPNYSTEYLNDKPASEVWCEQNLELFRFLSNALHLFNPDVYARFASVKEYLSSKGLKPLCGIWFGAAINEGVTESTKTHIDWGDYSYNCVVPWGEYTSGELVLH
jgi:hypothetical protein